MPEKVVIIGSGPAGMTAAVYTSRANLNPFVIEGFQSGGTAGGQLTTTGIVENFPGFPEGIDGQQLVQNIRTQAEKFGARMVMEDVENIEKGDNGIFQLKTSGGSEYEAYAVIVATGANARRLPLESEKQFWGKGISACAVCDGGLPFFRDQELAVIGGGDTAIEDAVHLTQFGSKIYIIHRRDELRAGKYLQKKAFDQPKIEIVWNKVVEEFFGEKTLTGLRLKDTKTGDISELKVKGAFEAIGHVPNTGFLEGMIILDKTGYILTEADSTVTSVEGIFAAGDVKDRKYRQAITAAGSGCMAAIETENWLQEKNII